MSPGILGKKIGMTQVFRPDGQVVPVTLLKAGPCMVVQRKTPATDGYDAVQLGLLEFVKPARINKPTTGHLKKAGVEGAKFMREFRWTAGDGDLKAGDQVLVDQFKPKDKVDVIGISKGRGFAGVVEAPSLPRRRRLRTDRCSIALRDRSARPAIRRAWCRACAWAATWATTSVTVRNLEVIEVDTEDNVLVVKGAVPGPNGGYVHGAEVEEVTPCRL